MPKQQREMSEAARLRGELARAEKEQRLAAALKENLLRRKLQSRERQELHSNVSLDDTAVALRQDQSEN